MTGVTIWRPRKIPGHTGTVPLVATFLVLGLAVAVFAYSPSLNPIDILAGRGSQIPVPKVVGLTQDRALIELKRSHLRGNVKFVYSTTVDPNKVVSQRPVADSTLEEESAATIFVSRGPALFTMPNYVGGPEKTARDELKKFDIKMSVERAANENVAAGAVVSQSLAPGLVALGGSTVAFVVSTGPQIRTVPIVAGLPLEGAAFNLGKAGFVLGKITNADNPLVPIGGVVGTDPVAGTQLPRDTAISIVVSAGPAPVSFPKVVNSKVDVATAQLTALGFVVAEVTQEGGFKDPLDGTVTDQNPQPGTMVRPGTIITLTVRHAKKPPPTTVPVPVPPPTLPPTTTTTTTIPATSTIVATTTTTVTNAKAGR